jgi:energy-coupling factor transporter ATP-binding protein EcfA2/tetratricopeptide (TPR) repeat protein
MFEELKEAVKGDDVEKVQDYVKSILLSELNTKDANGNLLFHALKSKGSRLAKFKILLKAGIGVRVYDKEGKSVKDLLNQDLQSASNDDSKELEELIHQVEIASYADLLYAQATNVNLQPSPFSLNPVSLSNQLFSPLADIVSSNDLKQQNPDIKILKQEIREKISSDLAAHHQKADTTQEIIDIVTSRHESYLSEEGIIPAENDLQKDSYDVRRINKNVSMPVKKSLSELQVTLKKSVLHIEQEKSLRGEILSALQDSEELNKVRDSNELNEILARTIHNKKEEESDNAINELLHRIPINPEYKTKLLNIKKEINAMTENDKQELELEYFPKPINEIIPNMTAIISPLSNVGSSSPDDVKKITDLISVGRANLEGDSEKSVVLLGPTGSGKSTLAHAFAGNELLPVEDEELGGWNIDINSTNGSSSSQARISHDKKSETKIPNKFILEDGVQVIDSPGFGDTSKIDEITNSFYINEIFRPNHKLKFVLVANESQLFSNRGNELIQTINNFINCFNDVEPVLGSISLIVTHVSANRKLIHVHNSLKKLIEQNDKVEGNVKSVLDALCSEDVSSSHISIFHQPKDNGDITSPTLDSVVGSLDYINVTEGLASASISPASESYAKELFNGVSDQLNQIIGLIIHVISDPYQHITESESSVFVQTEKVISSLLPPDHDVPVDYVGRNLPNFVEIEILKQLRDNLNSVDLGADTFADTVPALNGLLKILAEYCDAAIKPLIANVLYALSQQVDYVEFFSKLCKLGTPSVDGLVEQLETLQDVTSSLYEEKVKSIELESNKSSDYYHEVVKYLTPYAQDESCKEKLYEANMRLGDFYKTQGDNEQALCFYLDGAELNTNHNTAYQEIGNLFFDLAGNMQERGNYDLESVICMKDLYKMALEHYKACFNVVQVKECFKKLTALIAMEQKLAPNAESSEAFDISVSQAEYHDSMSYTDLTKSWWKAFSQAKTDANRAIVFKKIAEKSGNDDFATRADSKNFLNIGKVIVRSNLLEVLKSIPEEPVSDEEAILLIDKYQPVEENFVQQLGQSYYFIDDFIESSA